MITSIMRDWGVSPSIVRINTTDDLSTITTTGYLTAQAATIQLLNNGAFEWATDDVALINYSNGEGFFTVDFTTNDTFIAFPTSPGFLSSTLANGDIFVGNASNVATGVAVTGDVTISNAGVTAIGAGKVLLAMLGAGITPAAVIKFAGQVTTAGGAAAEAITVTGAVAATDRAFVQVVDNGTNNVTALQAVVTTNTLTVTFSADPGNDCVINYQLIRTAS